MSEGGLAGEQPSRRSSETFQHPVQQPWPIGTAPFLDGAVVHDGRSGRLFRLNHTAAQMWRCLRDGDHEEMIVGALARTHGVDPAAVRRDLEAFVGALRQAGLLGSDGAVEERPAARPRPPRGRPALDGAYRIGERVVRVVCHPANVAAAFAPLAAPAEVRGGMAEARLALFRARGAFVLTCDDRFVERLDSARAARWAMVRQLVLASRRGPCLALLHAGAVAAPAGCLLLCGGSGAGKSSLLAALVHAGFGFVADDILPLEEATELVSPVPLAISIKRGSWPAIGRLFPGLAAAPVIRFGGRTMRYLWPDASAVAIEPCPVAAALFPRYVKGAPVTLTPVDPLHALSLLGEGGSVLPSRDAGLDRFLRWWGRLPVYELCYGRLDDAVREVRSVTGASGHIAVSAPRSIQPL